MNNEYTVVTRAMDEITANIIKISLEDAGIPAVVRRFESAMFDGIFTNLEGAWGEVLVPTDDVERARAVLADYAEQNKQAGEDQ